MKNAARQYFLKIFCLIVALFSFGLDANCFNCKDSITSDLVSSRPEIDDGFHAHIRVQVRINKNPSEVTAWFDNVAPEKIIHSTGTVAGIAASKNIPGPKWGKPNSQRLVCYADDETSFEQVLENVPGKVFRYQLWDFTTERSFAFKYALAEFTVVPQDEHHSLLRWDFSFKPSSFIFRIPLNQYLENTFRAHMEHGLKNIKSLLES